MVNRRYRGYCPSNKEVQRALAILLCSLTQAQAHDFYDAYCCGGRDCAPVSSSDITWTPRGWYVPAGTSITTHQGQVLRTREGAYVPERDVRSSEDGDVHLCIVDGNPRCLYIGAGG